MAINLRDAARPLGGTDEPHDIAWVAVYLASDQARWVTGLELVIDGGYTARRAATMARRGCGVEAWVEPTHARHPPGYAICLKPQISKVAATCWKRTFSMVSCGDVSAYSAPMLHDHWLSLLRRTT